MRSKAIHTLLQILPLQTKNGTLHLTTAQLGKILKCSQQTASRRIHELERLQYIQREFTTNGQKISLTANARQELKKTYLVLQAFFQPPDFKPISIHGKIVRGLGEGAYYMGQEEYWNALEKQLGFEPYCGTLNVRVSSEDVDFIHQLESFQPIVIEGFKKENRSFGSLTCYKAKLNETYGALVFAERTSHGENIIEFIAPIHLRSHYNLKDGDLVTIVVDFQDESRVD